jgi:hypothetical protein
VRSPRTPDELLSRDIQDKYYDIVRDACKVTGRQLGWGHGDLNDVLDALDAGPSRARDTITALRDAAEAKHVFTALGGPAIQLERLRYFYHLSVGRWPDGASSDALLVEAAAAAVFERKKQASVLTVFAKFILTVAHECGTTHTYPVLAQWLASLGHSLEDAREYMQDECRRPAWLLIRLTGVWPTEVSVLTLTGDREAGFPRTCSPSREGLMTVLREILAESLPSPAVVDLEVPRELLHEGIEHWDLIHIHGLAERLIDNYQPRLRWSERDRVVEGRWKQRARNAKWQKQPIRLQPGDGDPACAAVRRQLRETPVAPYLVGRQQAGIDVSDPLLAALVEGCGFIFWFPCETDSRVFDQLLRAAKRLNRHARRHELPERFLRLGLSAVPAVIWDDPEGREGYKLPRAPAQGP